MVFCILITFLSVVVDMFGQQAMAQRFGLPRSGFQGLSALTNGNPLLRQQQQRQQKSYRTCIGQTAAGDEMRVSFTGLRENQPANWRDGSSNNHIEISASITSGSIIGQFQLVTTEFGRIDGMCESASLGNILTEQQNTQSMFRWWNSSPAQARTIGLVGTSFELSPGKTVIIRDNINSALRIDLISGSGMALCPLRQIINNKCIDMISLCCAISRDRKPATFPVTRGVQGRFGGMMGGFNAGMGAMSIGNMNRGMSSIGANMIGPGAGMQGVF